MPAPSPGRRVLLGLLGIALIATAGLIAPVTADATVRHTYIVATKTDLVARPLATARQGGGTVLTRFERVLSGFTAELTPAQAIRLAADPSVRTVVRDTTFHVDLADATQTSPVWGLDRIDQRDRPLDGRYGYLSTGAGSTVFVVDSGVRLGHRQFAGRASSGYDFVGRDRTATDCYGHGTHVAGTVAGSTYGVAKSARIVSVRMLDCAGDGSVADLLDALDWVVAHKPAGPAVVNLSLGLPDTYPGADLVDQAAAAVVRAGIPVVAAAGNNATSACDFSPAKVPSVITVAASDITDTRADFSDDGSCVDLFAPGVDIRSAGNASDTATALLSGTSMAAPHVTGMIARMQQDNPLASPATLAAEVTRRATTGVIDDASGAPNRLLYSAPPSRLAGRPTATTITRSDSRKTVTVRWAPPTSTGGSAISGYRVIRTGSADARSKRIAVATVSAGTRSSTFGSLVAGGSYTVRVVPMTAEGPGWGAAVSTRLLSVPGRARIKKASSGTKKSKGISVRARWAKPTTGGPVAAYRVKADRVGSRLDKTVTVSASKRSVKITGLAKKKRYRITVQAVNVAGRGAWSAKSGKVTAR